jgi:hypothetical protein
LKSYIAMFVPTASALSHGMRPQTLEFDVATDEPASEAGYEPSGGVSVGAAEAAMENVCDALGLNRKPIREVTLDDHGASFHVRGDDLASTILGKVTVVRDLHASTPKEGTDVSAKEIDWTAPIGVSIPSYGVVDAKFLIGPDDDGDYRVNFECSREPTIRGIQWFRADGSAVGNSSKTVVNL